MEIKFEKLVSNSAFSRDFWQKNGLGIVGIAIARPRTQITRPVLVQNH